ncbi:MAG: 3-deoxy-7-phosphoheptulonate synthase [Planctomycetota bacterium]
MTQTPQPWRVHRTTWPEWNEAGKTRPVRVRHVVVGGERPTIIAGPCAVESLEQTLEVALEVRDAGADLLRGGAYKPRTSPYSFQGLGEKGLEILAQVRERSGLPVVTEVMDPRLVGLVASYADVLQIGSRSMQNFPLLIEAGKSGKPILLKRGWSSTVEEWLGAAEYIALQGDLDIVLCERGIRTFTMAEYARNTLDISVIATLRKHTFLPVIADPSHAAGTAALVPATALAALGAGADGMIIEVLAERADRNGSLCDGHQAVRPSVLRPLIQAWRGEPGNGLSLREGVVATRELAARAAAPPSGR